MDKLNVCLEDIINDSNATLEQKINVYATGIGDPEQKHGKVLVENGKIKGYQPYKSMEYIDITLTIDENGAKEETFKLKGVKEC